MDAQPSHFLSAPVFVTPMSRCGRGGDPNRPEGEDEPLAISLGSSLVLPLQGKDFDSKSLKSLFHIPHPQQLLPGTGATVWGLN